MTHIELKQKLQNKLNLANEQFTKVVNYINENIDMFESMNLKLYHAACLDLAKYPLCKKYQQENDYDLFQDFCNISYEMTIQDLKENFNINFHEMQNHIGRTSSFYLYDFYATYNRSLQIDEMIYNFYNNNIQNNDFQNLTINSEDLKLEIEFQEYDIENNYSYDEEDMEEISIALDYFIEDFYNDFINHCKDIKIVYIEIKSFKDNQVQYFEDYLQNFEEELQEQIPINTITIIVCSNKEYNFTIVDSLYSMELNTQIYKALNVIKNIYKNVTSKEFKENLFIEDVLHTFYECKITLKYTPKNYKFGI